MRTIQEPSLMHEKSRSAFARLQKVMPGGVSSGARGFGPVGGEPLVIARGEGASLVDLDGNSYLDFCSSWGAALFGHSPSFLVEELREALGRGLSYGLSCEGEERLASLLVDRFPSCEQFRFVSSGTEAAMTAIRLARGVTGRDLVIKFAGNYHGHADPFLIEAGSAVALHHPQASSAGVPPSAVEAVRSLPYNNCGAIESLLSDPFFSCRLAAIIVEPIAGNIGVVPATRRFLQTLRHLSREAGALLIFDEVITGLRVARGGAQELYGIEPDLTLVGKIVGGGLPAAALGGKAEIMRWLSPVGPVFHAGTLSGNPLAMHAGCMILKQIDAIPDFYKELERRTAHFVAPLEEAISCAREPMALQRVGSMLTLFFGVDQVHSLEETKQLDRERFSLFFRSLLNRGIFIPPSPFESWFVSWAHTPERLEEAGAQIAEELMDRP